MKSWPLSKTFFVISIFGLIPFVLGKKLGLPDFLNKAAFFITLFSPALAVLFSKDRREAMKYGLLSSLALPALVGAIFALIIMVGLLMKGGPESFKAQYIVKSFTTMGLTWIVCLYATLPAIVCGAFLRWLYWLYTGK
jgi:hypothetical protein